MRALVVDDELHARRGLRAALEGSGAFAAVEAAANAVEALRAIRARPPDVLFLDVQLPKVNGFQLLAMIEPAVMPRVVFVSAYDEFAVKAFDENALDYLLKPVQRDRLARTLEKLRQSLRDGPRPVYAGPALERIPCVGAGCVRLVDVAEVELVRSGEGGVYVVTPRGEFFTELTLQVLEARTELVRCHKQYLVSVRAVEQIVDQGPRDRLLRTRSGKEVPASRRYFPRIRERLGLRL